MMKPTAARRAIVIGSMISEVYVVYDIIAQILGRPIRSRYTTLMFNGRTPPRAGVVGMGHYGQSDPRRNVTSNAVAARGSGGAAIRGVSNPAGAMVGADCGVSTRPGVTLRTPDFYVTRGSLFEGSTADVSVRTDPLHLTAIYVRISAAAAPTGDIRIRVWDTDKPTAQTLDVATDTLMWESEAVAVGGVFFWEPPAMTVEEMDCGAFHRMTLLGPIYSNGLRIQAIDDGAGNAVLGANMIRLHVQFFR